MDLSNGASFDLANGSAMCLGGGQSYGMQSRDGTRPASARWLFAVLVFQL